MPHLRGLHGKYQGQREGRRSEEETWSRDFLVISLGRDKLKQDNKV